MVKTVAAKTRKAIVRAAQHSAEKIRAVAADAASAATQAAAGVVLASTASALEGAVRKSRNPHPASKSASGELNDPQRARSRKGLLDVAGGAWQDLGDLISGGAGTAPCRDFRKTDAHRVVGKPYWRRCRPFGGDAVVVATGGDRSTRCARRLVARRRPYCCCGHVGARRQFGLVGIQ